MKLVPICIYCSKDASDALGVAHVIPEALVRNPMALPKGYVCDGCNRYLGKLDSSLVALPHISLTLQWHGVVGKRGRPRRKIGSVSAELQGDDPKTWTEV